MPKHPTETSAYWFALARSERAFADEDRSRRGGSVQSIRIHLENAAEYEARALAIVKAEQDTPEEQARRDAVSNAMVYASTMTKAMKKDGQS